MVLFCISLIANDVEYLSFHMFVEFIICMASLVGYLFIFFARFLTGLLSFESSLYDLVCISFVGYLDCKYFLSVCREVLIFI